MELLEESVFQLPRNTIHSQVVTSWGGVGCRKAKQGLLESVAPGRSPETLSSRISDTFIHLQLMSPFNGVQASCGANNDGCSANKSFIIILK